MLRRSAFGPHAEWQQRRVGLPTVARIKLSVIMFARRGKDQPRRRQPRRGVGKPALTPKRVKGQLFLFWKKPAKGRVAIARRRPRDVRGWWRPQSSNGNRAARLRGVSCRPPASGDYKKHSERSPALYLWSLITTYEIPSYTVVRLSTSPLGRLQGSVGLRGDRVHIAVACVSIVSIVAFAANSCYIRSPRRSWKETDSP